MKKLVEKLNYSGQDRIAIINAEDSLIIPLSEELKDITVDSKIDPRFPYDFIIVFVKSVSEIDHFSSLALHNLLVDGILWFCYPKKTSGKYCPGVDRDHGWKALTDSGFRGIRVVSIDEDWSAIRFRNVKFIGSRKHTSLN